jgi:hypothetical protein
MPVTWKTVWLREPQQLTFPNGEPFMVAVESLDWDDLSLEFPRGSKLVLHGALDADERFEWPRTHVFAGNDPAELFFFGGPTAYCVSSDGRAVERLETHRDLAHYECGSFDVIIARNIAVIVYEVGILVIGDDLRQRWLRRKYMGPGEVSLEGDAIWIREPHSIPIGHRLSDGDLISAPEDYSPGVRRGGVLDEREVFDGCVKAWDREAVISAFQAIASHLATLTPRSAEIDALRKGLAAEIEKMTADASARPTRGFATDVAMRWCALGFDMKGLFGVAIAAVYNYKWGAR